MSFLSQIQYWWDGLNIDEPYLVQVKAAADTIQKHWSDYQAVTDKIGIPPYVVGAIHFRESSFNFKTHLANGDPLFASDGTPLKTIHVPHDLGPFDSWKDGAIGAFKRIGFDHGYHWDLLNALDNMERYNGLGYRTRGLATPYVWAGSNVYTGGMYQSDGVFSPKAIDGRPGCACILQELKSRGVDLNEKRISLSGDLIS